MLPFFVQKVYNGGGNVGYASAVYPVLYESYNFMEFTHMYMYTYTTADLQASGFIEEVRGILHPKKPSSRDYQKRILGFSLFL